MTAQPDETIREMPGDAALPRQNGELVFEAPWESRAFGLAVAMEEQGVYEWSAFVDELVKEIAAEDAAGSDSTYYERWLVSLERLLLSRGLVDATELEARHEEYASGLHDEDGHL
jgi:nitrile hydratase accessory protein